MDLTKAQRLLTKIGALLDHGNAQELSRLEKDLIKTYILQLYDAVTDEGTIPAEQEEQIKFVEHKMPKREAPPKMEIPKVEEPVVRKTEPVKSTVPDYATITEKEKQVEKDIPFFEPVKSAPPVETKTYQAPEKVIEVVETPRIQQTPSEINEALNKLFDLPKADELAGRLNHVPIASIESAMGLNDRIFILKELFGGDKALFDVTCTKLNHLNSYAEARTLLMSGPASDFNWSDPKRIRMAEQFIRIVSRRYPKSIS